MHSHVVFEASFKLSAKMAEWTLRPVVDSASFRLVKETFELPRRSLVAVLRLEVLLKR
jgi:hypothetical protein